MEPCVYQDCDLVITCVWKLKALVYLNSIKHGLSKNAIQEHVELNEKLSENIDKREQVYWPHRITICSPALAAIFASLSYKLG